MDAGITLSGFDTAGVRFSYEPVHCLKTGQCCLFTFIARPAYRRYGNGGEFCGCLSADINDN